MANSVTTTDDTLRVLASPDLHSEVLAQLPKGTVVKLGDVATFDQREWMKLTLEDGTSGYALAPSVRGHTTLGSERAEFFGMAAVPIADGTNRSLPVVLRPAKGFYPAWPKYCVRCFSQDPTNNLMLKVGANLPNPKPPVRLRSAWR